MSDEVCRKPFHLMTKKIECGVLSQHLLIVIYVHGMFTQGHKLKSTILFAI
jgi:hypothetical protein